MCKLQKREADAKAMRTARPLGKSAGMLILCGITAAATASAEGSAANADRSFVQHDSLETRARLRALSFSKPAKQAAYSRYRLRKFALLRYEKPIEIADKSFVFRVRALSKKQALMTLELLF